MDPDTVMHVIPNVPQEVFIIEDNTPAGRIAVETSLNPLQRGRRIRLWDWLQRRLPRDPNRG